jgi:DMSO/TMAO reductase YedYZ molybdopterin-dependent catalytic subunit
MIASLGAELPAQAPTTEVALEIRTLAGETKKLAEADFQNSIHVRATGHDGVQHDFEGIDLRGILTKFGTPADGDLRGKEMADYVVAEGSDGYKAVFSLAEIDGDLGVTQVLIADKMDGHPLDGHDGPLRLIVPADKRPARWVRMLKEIRVLRTP